jgi:hypothetical protein
MTRILPEHARKAPNVEVVEQDLPEDAAGESRDADATIHSGIVIRELKITPRSKDVVVRRRVEKGEKID